MDTLPCRLVLSLLTTSQCTGYTPFRLDCSQWCSSPVLQRQSCDAVSQELAASLTPTLVKPGDGAGGHCIAQDPPAATFWTDVSQPETPNDTRKPRASRGPAGGRCASGRGSPTLPISRCAHQEEDLQCLLWLWRSTTPTTSTGWLLSPSPSPAAMAASS